MKFSTEHNARLMGAVYLGFKCHWMFYLAQDGTNALDIIVNQKGTKFMSIWVFCIVSAYT